jgi:N-formylglutamate deformylase
MSDPFYIIEPKGPKVPIIISVPHCGLEIADEVKGTYLESQLKSLDDADWFVHDLYNFASEMGVTIIHAKYHRWLIDLNRDVKSLPLYNDGRLITGLCSTTDFFGRPIYKADQEPTQKEIGRRLDTYFWPYYKKVDTLLAEVKAEFGHALLWDAHSIRKNVSTIQKADFPDMILGNDDQTTATQPIIDVAFNSLKEGGFQVNHNTPFKGGHITRYFGKPDNGINALQLEMNKILYMDDSETKFDESRANAMREVLKPVFEKLIEEMTK